MTARAVAQKWPAPCYNSFEAADNDLCTLGQRKLDNQGRVCDGRRLHAGTSPSPPLPDRGQRTIRDLLPAAPHSRAASILFSNQRKGYETEMTKLKKETNQPAPADSIEKQDSRPPTHLQSKAKREFEAIGRIGSYSVHADSKWKVPLADRRSAPFRLVPVLWLRVRTRGHLLRYTQEYGFCSEPG